MQLDKSSREVQSTASLVQQGYDRHANKLLLERTFPNHPGELYALKYVRYWIDIPESHRSSRESRKITLEVYLGAGQQRQYVEKIINDRKIIWGI